MTKTELIAAIAKKTGYDEKPVGEIINTFIDVTMKQVSKNDEVRITGFGTFSKRRRAARKYTDFDGNVVKAKATSIPYFTAGEVFKRKVRGKK